jgi:hypothetical protein
MPQVPISEWLPDRARFGGPGLQQFVNLCPTADGCQSVPDVTPDDLPALTSECRGAVRGRTQAGIDILLAGTATKVYEGQGGALVDISQAGDYNLGPDDRWEFDFYGEQRFATCKAEPVQVSSAPGVDLADLSAHASRARAMAVLGEFLMLGDIVGMGDNASAIGTQEAGLHWSAIGNLASWPTVGTQDALDVESDFQVLQGDGGPIVQIVPAAEYTAIFRERQLHRADYIGKPYIFAFRKVENEVGALVPGTAIAVGSFIHYLSEDGFRVFAGSQSGPTGHEKVDRTIRSLIDWSRARSRCSVAHAPLWRSIVWSLPLGGGANSLVCYNYELQRWWQITKSIEWVFSAPPSLSIGSLDDPATYGDLNLDSATPPNLGDVNLDTIGGGFSSQTELSVFLTNHCAHTFFATTHLAGAIQTQDYEAIPGRRSNVRYIRPVFNGTGSIRASVGGRYRPTDAPSYTALRPINASGVIPMRVGGRYHQAILFTSGVIDNLNGFDVAAVPMGKR